jgi:Tol biopolymer transport system component
MLAASLLAGCSGKEHTLKPPPPEPPTLTQPYIAYPSVTPDSIEVRLKPASGPDLRLTNLDPSTQWVQISPDGKRLAFMQLNGGLFDVFVSNVDGTGVVNVTNDPSASDVRPHWSGDSRRVLYTRLNNGPANVYSMNADGTDDHPVTSDNATVLLDVTPNSSWILVGRYTGLWMVDLATGDERQLDTLHVQMADYSPDGSRIAVCRGNPGDSDIEVMDGNAKNRENLTTGLVGTAWAPSWSPDGAYIAFVAGPYANEMRLHTIKADGSDLRERTLDVQDLEPCWGPKP